MKKNKKSTVIWSGKVDGWVVTCGDYGEPPRRK